MKLPYCSCVVNAMVAVQIGEFMISNPARDDGNPVVHALYCTTTVPG